MSHSSGIPVSSGLKEKFGSSLSDTSVRLIKAQIENEEIIEVLTKQVNGSLEDDLSQVAELLEKDRPCYILYKLDGSSWILLCYVPDKAKVKEKMIYASTRFNLKQQLGLNYFTDEIFGTVPADFSREGYRLHVTSKKMEAPLTESEQLKKNEIESGEIHVGGSSTYVHGVAFPVDNSVMDAVNGLINGSHGYVRIAIDCSAEKIILDTKENIDLDAFKNQINKEEPRFHFFNYTHEFEGSTVTSCVFVYSSPDGSKGTKSAPVRMRMLYSSSKANVSEIVNKSGGKIDAKLEVNSGEDIDEEALLLQIHPQQEKKEQNFSKPTMPGKGPRRLIRNNKN